MPVMFVSGTPPRQRTLDDLGQAGDEGKVDFGNQQNVLAAYKQIIPTGWLNGFLDIYFDAGDKVASLHDLAALYLRNRAYEQGAGIEYIPGTPEEALSRVAKRLSPTGKEALRQSLGPDATVNEFLKYMASPDRRYLEALVDVADVADAAREQERLLQSESAQSPRQDAYAQFRTLHRGAANGYEQAAGKFLQAAKEYQAKNWPEQAKGAFLEAARVYQKASHAHLEIMRVLYPRDDPTETVKGASFKAAHALAAAAHALAAAGEYEFAAEVADTAAYWYEESGSRRTAAETFEFAAENFKRAALFDSATIAGDKAKALYDREGQSLLAGGAAEPGSLHVSDVFSRAGSDGEGRPLWVASQSPLAERAAVVQSPHAAQVFTRAGPVPSVGSIPDVDVNRVAGLLRSLGGEQTGMASLFQTLLSKF